MAVKTFEQEIAERGGFRTRVRMSILPPRKKVSGPRTGAQLTDAARTAADCWYFCATPLRTYVTNKIEERYEALPKEEKYLKRKSTLINEARTILNEHRNLVVESALPLFDVYTRNNEEKLVDGQPLPEADAHAHGYLVHNIFYMLVQTYLAAMPEFVKADVLTDAESVMRRLGALQQEKLQQELRNYRFVHRLVKAPE